MGAPWISDSRGASRSTHTIYGSTATNTILTTLQTRVVAPLLALSSTSVGVSYSCDFPVSPYGQTGDRAFQGGIEPGTNASSINGAITGRPTIMIGGDASDGRIEALGTLSGLPVHTTSLALTCSAGKVAGGCWRPGAKRVIILITDDVFHGGPDPASSSLYDLYTAVSPAPQTWLTVLPAMQSTNTVFLVMNINTQGTSSPGAAQYLERLGNLGQPSSDAFLANTNALFGTASDAVVARIKAIHGKTGREEASVGRAHGGRGAAVWRARRVADTSVDAGEQRSARACATPLRIASRAQRAGGNVTPLAESRPARRIDLMRPNFLKRSTGLSFALFLTGALAQACATGATTDEGVVGGGDTGTNPFIDTGVPDMATEDSTVAPDTEVDSGSADGSTDSVADTSSPDASETSSCSSGCPVGYWDIDKNALTGTCGCEYKCDKKSAADPIDDKYADDNCDGSDGVLEQCVFVSASTGVDDPTAGGTSAKPMKTIGAAITRAKAIGGGASVCVSGETYNEYVQMESGVSVYGGFDPNDANVKWKRVATANSVITNAGTVVFAAKIDVDTHLEGLTLTATAPTGIGASAYGVRLGGGSGTLYVRYDKISVASGAPGADGIPGADGAKGDDGKSGDAGLENNTGGRSGGISLASSCGATGGPGGTGGYSSSAGGDGVAGAGGAGGGIGGAGSGSCTSAASNGGPGGKIVTTGANGSPGGTSSKSGSLASAGLYTPAIAPSGSDGSAGAAGGGGGGGGGRTKGEFWSGCAGTSDFGGGGGGSGGNGGCGGRGGGGGQGGGGSFGVTAAGGSVVIDLCDITVAGGANGGNGKGAGVGGNGGTGGAGGAGVRGGAPAGANSGTGGVGGQGAGGGTGGPGSGGAGGPSVCVAFTSSASITFATGLGKNACTNGGGGAGGLGGSSGGTTGAAGPTGASGSTLTL